MNDTQVKTKIVTIVPELVDKLSCKPVLVIGDIMLDQYLIGETERVSPEAPVPIVHISSEKKFLGGAGNVARNIAALGGSVKLVGAVGNDIHGDFIHGLLDKENISATLIKIDGRPTTVKTRVMSRRQQMIRLDQESRHSYTKKELEKLLSLIEHELVENQIIILSDYSKGLVSKTFMLDFTSLIKEKSPQAKILVDPKPSNVSLYNGFFALTPNIKETSESAGGMPVNSEEELLAAGRKILKHVSIKHLLATLGSNGMLLFLSPEEAWHIPTVGRDVFDVTGAGDTVIATFGLALSAGFDPLVSAILANYAAGIVVARVGAAVVTPGELQQAILALPQPELSLWS